jgi:hypothetical protein
MNLSAKESRQLTGVTWCRKSSSGVQKRVNGVKDIAQQPIKQQ